jgi:hypothetical protein
MRGLLCVAIAAAASLGLARVAAAEPYQDYTPEKGAWQVTEVHVDPSHIDDYLTGLRTSWAPGEEIAKKHGLIDAYQVMVRVDPAGTGANVLLAQHFTSLAGLEPDKARDQAIEAESYAALPKAKGQEMVAGFEKYRSFVGDGFFQVMTFAK